MPVIFSPYLVEIDDPHRLIKKAADESWKELDLSGAGLCVLPNSVCNLKQLERLILGKAVREKHRRRISNPITELPLEFSLLKELRSLDLFKTKVSELPECMSTLKNLQFLSIRETEISSLPSWIGQLSNLQTLDCRNTSITDLPPSISRLKKLKSLLLSHTNISYFPESLSGLCNLQNLDLSGTNISCLPDSLSNFCGLQTLNLSSTKIEKLPEGIGNLKELNWLDLGETQLLTLPRTIGGLKKLESLELRGNKLDLSNHLGELSSLRFLRFDVEKMMELPEWLRHLSNLESLDISQSKISQLPEWIGELSSLESLNLSSTNISDLPDSIGRLSNLEVLNLTLTEVSELPKSLCQLKSLKAITLKYTKISELPDNLGALCNLESLILENTKLSKLPEGIGELHKLKELDLENTKVTKFPNSITKIKSLEKLLLRNTHISELPDDIGQLNTLRDLDLRNTQISKLPESIGQLKMLERLLVSHARLSEIPSTVVQMTSLRSLDVRWNRLAKLPNCFQSWQNPPDIFLIGNPLPIPGALLSGIPPTETISPILSERPNIKPVIDFYFQSQDAEAAPLYEAKLLIVGEGAAGKTTLAKKIKEPEYSLRCEVSTEGIDILQWQFEQSNNQTFRVNMWDFGGQEIYHATHQFFFTKRSLYVLVVDNRRENPNFYYWLNVVRLFSDDSPVLIVKNERQDRQCELNESQLRAEFKNLINESVCVNLADNRGLDALRAIIQKHISTISEIQDPWPHKWRKVRYALENDTKDYITQEEYFQLCRSYGVIDRSESLHLSSLLHSLGICLHFQSDVALKHYFILNPTWVTHAVYKVTDNKKIQDNLGRFNSKELKKIWSSHLYVNMQDELLALMKKFGICYSLRHQPETYIAPSLLSVEKPDYSWEITDNLILRYDYEFMPKGILTRLIVEMHEFIQPDPSMQGLVWKTGVILQFESARAEVIEYYNKSEISIRVSGSQRKTLLDWIRLKLRDIHSSFPHLDCQEFIPCNCERCGGCQDPHLYRYSDLNRRLEKHVYNVECEKSYQRVSVAKLLSDITSPAIDRFDEVSTAPDAQFHGNQINVSLNLPEQSFKKEEKHISVQNNNYGDTNFQNTISGGNINQAQNIKIAHSEKQQITDDGKIWELVSYLRKDVVRFPEEIQEDLNNDIEEIEDELRRPSEKRRSSRLKGRLLTLYEFNDCEAVSSSDAADFMNNTLCIAEKLGIILAAHTR